LGRGGPHRKERPYSELQQKGENCNERYRKLDYHCKTEKKSAVRYAGLPEFWTGNLTEGFLTRKKKKEKKIGTSLRKGRKSLRGAHL